MASNAFAFKLDPSSLPQLTSKGDNYADWRPAWKIAFEWCEIWDVIDQKPPTAATAAATATDDPAATAAAAIVAAAANEKRKKDNNKAMVMLMSAVHADHLPMITTAATAHQAWTSLQDRYDRDTAHSTIHQFRHLTSMRYDDQDDLVAHLDTFHQAWSHLERRCRSSSQELAKNLTPVFSSEAIKGSFFLSTLPESMDNIINNLSSRNINKFIDIEPEMLDIAQRRAQPADEKAMYTKTAARGKQRANVPRQSPTSGNQCECTWCRKRNFTFVGHLYTECPRLAEYKKQKDRTNDKGKNKSRHNARQAAADDDQDDDVDEDRDDAVAFLASASLSPSTPTTSRSMTIGRSATAEIIDLTDADDIQAFAVNVTPQLLATSSTWIFDSGATRHMSGHESDFIEIRPRTGTISIANGTKLAVDGIGTILMLLRLPDGTVVDTVFTDALYSRGLQNTRLFSWCQVRHRFQMSAHGNDIFVHKRDGKLVMWANYREGGFIIQTDDKPDAYKPSTAIVDQASFADYNDFHKSVGHAQAINYSAYVKNLKPHAGLPNKITPYEALFGNRPSIGHLRPYMADCYLYIPKEARKPGTKLLDRAERAHLVGYDSNAVMRLYVPSRNTITTATLAHVRFVPPGKRIYWDIENTTPITVSTTPDLSSDDNNNFIVEKRSESTQFDLGGAPGTVATSPLPSNARNTTVASPSRIPTAIRGRNSPAATPSPTSRTRSTRAGTRSRKQYLKDFGRSADCADDDETEIRAVAMIAVDEGIPTTLRQALGSAESTEWQQAVDAELAALISK
ncbi:uncharacterized protein Triagg1_957 [Trichoderma aggressivum f. europaeum]|uniref:Uncharacterized protein n=1 Tax=Trichoderma aggressivum f. europaeum TaxID=173218 RepID=A0AAE1IKE6_9HYPO|nr:hypothetical protein Triagg1_957 [Trichoderma aggressivum f. europaeum]